MAEGDEGFRCFRPLLLTMSEYSHREQQPVIVAQGLAMQTSELNGAFQHVG